MKIVFVHFGKQLPKHLKLNISRCLELFPSNQIVLITNEECRTGNFRKLEVYRYRGGSAWHEIHTTLTHPKDFRQNFWFTSIARFLALEKYMEDNSAELIHLESDVILASDFPFDDFKKIKCSFAFPIVSPTQGIASTLYLSNLEAAQTLANFSLEQVKKDSRATDMTILRNFYDEFPERVQVLPIGPLDRNCYRTFLDDSLFLQMGMSSQLLGGIFDGADIGYYVYGIDPRNAKGIKILRKSIETNFLNVPKIDLRYSKTRNFLDAWDSNLNTLVPIFSLHLHSKNPKLFSPSKSLKFLKSGLLAYLEPESWNFVPNIFLRALFIALSRRIKLLHRGLRR